MQSVTIKIQGQGTENIDVSIEGPMTARTASDMTEKICKRIGVGFDGALYGDEATMTLSHGTPEVLKAMVKATTGTANYFGFTVEVLDAN